MPRRRGEGGFTLIEASIAMVIVMLVMVSVSASVTIVDHQSVSMSGSNQAIDQLQVAEESVVQDLHAATAWYTSSACSTSTTAPSADSLYFTADLYGATPCISVTLSSGTLTVTSVVGGKTHLQASVSNLDNTSAITPGAAVNAGSPSQSFTDRLSVALTMDSPRPGAPHQTQTTVADPTVIAFNIEYACKAAYAISPGAQTC